MRAGENSYVKWLGSQGIPVFHSDDSSWRRYGKALIPATFAPFFTTVSAGDAAKLLKESRAWLLRYCSDAHGKETRWWYVVCDKYDPSALSQNTRSKLRRGLRRCAVEQVSPDWLAENGYACYASAFNRYRNAMPVAQQDFRRQIEKMRTGPFECWGVFVGQHLAGYSQCVIERQSAATSVIKLDPSFLKYYTSYALLHGIAEHYVCQRGLIVINGNRSILHGTAFQEFLLKLGFKKLFCRLNIAYRPWLNVGIRVAFPFRSLLGSLPDHARLHDMRALMIQEEIRRACQ
jgi:hypothetical protein